MADHPYKVRLQRQGNKIYLDELAATGSGRWFKFRRLELEGDSLLMAVVSMPSLADSPFGERKTKSVE